MSETVRDMTEVVSGRARAALLRRLIDYIAMPASRAAPQDRSMGGDILLDMLFHADEDDRILCAQRLANMREAPRRVLRYLAQCNFAVAKPLLEENEVFDGADLLQMIDHVSAEHRVAIAGRKEVSPAVSDKLASTGETNVLRTLLANKGAVLSENAVDLLVAQSRDDHELCKLLIARPELCPAQAMAMFWWSDGATRRIVLQRFSAERTEMIELCSDIFAKAAEEDWQDPIARKSLQLIERRQRNRAALERSQYDSLEGALSIAAKDGMTPELAQEIGYLAGVKPVTIAKIIADKGAEGLAVICKATGLKREALKNFWQALRRPFENEDGSADSSYTHVMETYEILSVAKAQTTLRYWNWSLSSAFSPDRLAASGYDEEEANDEAAFSTSQRTARLVFGN